MTAIELYNTLGRKERLKLAARDVREMDQVFCDARGERIYDAVISDRVLALCDRYASKVRK